MDMDIKRIGPEVSDQMSFYRGRYVVATANEYPMRRLARVFGFVGFASLTYVLTIVGIAIEAAIIEF